MNTYAVKNLAVFRVWACQVAMVIGLCLVGSISRGATDTFEDGNDDGWTHYDPHASHGAGGTFSLPSSNLPYPDYRYRIQAPASTDPNLFGFANAGSFRNDVPAGIAGLTWTVHGWNQNESQSFGGFVGINQENDGTLSGFGLVYSTKGSLDVIRLERGNATILASSAITLNTASAYYFTLGVFPGGGLTGGLYEFPDFISPLARVDAIGPAIANGAAGLYLYSNKSQSGIGATFDNFAIGIVPEPSTSNILAAGGILGLSFTLRLRSKSR